MSASRIKINAASLFFLGWLLSPFTWWNDAFINIPLSYVLASVIFRFTHLSFKWLVLGIYWLSNIAGLACMYFAGRQIVPPGKKNTRTLLWTIIFLIAYSAIMVYLDCLGKLVPLGGLKR